ncbi:unnamed protein product [Aphanomyces euteiches]
MHRSKFLELEPQEQIATFAAGSFWDIQPRFQRLPGVVNTRAGFANVAKPHKPDAEAVQVKYDASQVSYKELLTAFWSMHDPTHAATQSTLHRSSIFTHNMEQHSEAKLDLKIRSMERKIVTDVEPLGSFYPAIESHQRYHGH